MSGGHYEYKQYQIHDIVEQLEGDIEDNRSGLSDKTIKEMEKAFDYLRLSFIYTHRIDWMLSGDDSEKYFHERLLDDLDADNLTEIAGK